MDINLGSTDRMIRLTLGTVLVYAALAASGVWSAVLMVLAVSALLNGVTGRCLIYRLLGISTAGPRRRELSRATGRPVAVEPRETSQSNLTTDDLAAAVKQAIEEDRADRLTIREGDWTLIDLPLTMTRSGVLEAPLLEFLRARAEGAGYAKLTVRH